MRKGADVLSKWVGESERQLRLLFAEAQKREPAIIFFDEIDGTALGVSQIQAHRLMPLFDLHGRR
jgi:SpoVK/Ycf46/Vps4 family AAA+-type ATPase